MARLVVVEARRLLPVAVLFLLLVVVSVYDGLSSPAEPVTTSPNSVPYKTLVHASQSGEVRWAAATNLDDWVTLHNALGLELPDHAFDPKLEVAVFLVNCQLISTQQCGEMVELTVIPDRNNCQVVLFDKSQLSTMAEPQFLVVEASGQK
ncbi:MAG TPA: hypothetical protein PKN71_01870 [Bacillota bacterium]|nr:hypothetical protein [Bacillota bacterium]HOC06044.1 hypothetical protein [Bacillota bacterium]HPZ21545.1 hypothetical protein [Bacillota bacterium]HQD19588.1 hypothetical protein [Bacillota bacterium]